MPALHSDRSLRRLVADLAKARAEDVEAVLAELDAGQRRRVLDMLGAYTGSQEKAQGFAEASPGLMIEGLSSGLGERLAQAARPAGSTGSPFELTPAAAEALRSSAEEMLELGLAFAPASPRPAPVSLLQRLEDVFTGDRRGA